MLSVRDLRVSFDTPAGVLQAADGVSFDLFDNSVLGVVGESGAGKTVTGLALLGLLPRHASVSGEVCFRGRNILGLSEVELRPLRGARIAMVFQDALGALNPLHRIGDTVAESLRVHDPELKSSKANERAVELLDRVGIPDPRTRARQYPHELSGGMRQRVVIAAAIANDPDVIIADEPTTALDVTTQAQVLEVLDDVRRRVGSAMILITHDLGVVSGVADDVLVMYAGRPVEIGPVLEVFRSPQHPYTIGLLSSLPRFAEAGRPLPRIVGQPPSLVDIPRGCAFHPRCQFAREPEPCGTVVPLSRALGSARHAVACHFAGELAPVGPAESTVAER